MDMKTLPRFLFVGGALGELLVLVLGPIILSSGLELMASTKSDLLSIPLAIMVFGIGLEIFYGEKKGS